MTLPDPVFACCARTFPVRPIIDVAETPWTRDELDARIDHWMTQLTMLAAWGEREESTQSGVCRVTITEFLEARIAEDEAAVRGALDGAADDGVWATAEDWEGGKERVKGKGILIYDEGGHTEGQAAYIARWDPARVLAECAAKRAILEDHGQFEPYCVGCETQCPCNTLCHLAAVYSDHPDYDKDWTL